MPRRRRRLSNAFKAKVALETITGVSTVAELATHQKVRANQSRNRRRRLFGLDIGLGFVSLPD